MTVKKVKVIKPTMKMYIPSKVIIMHTLKELTLSVKKKKATLVFLSNQGNISIICLEYV